MSELKGIYEVLSAAQKAGELDKARSRFKIRTATKPISVSVGALLPEEDGDGFRKMVRPGVSVTGKNALNVPQSGIVSGGSAENLAEVYLSQR